MQDYSVHHCIIIKFYVEFLTKLFFNGTLI